VLRVVSEHPGISVREIGERLGVDATGLYRVTNKLTADGRLRKNGTQLYAVESEAAAHTDTAIRSARQQSTDAGAQPTPTTPAGASADTANAVAATSST
jgi:DNA-binding IclR family transcriptional regulator